GDLAATDATRVLRLPGFANRKLAVEFVVHVVQATDQIYSLGDFRIPQDSPEAPRNVGESSRKASALQHKSQSELDWAYAMRALARGDNPEAVVQRIADFRFEEKPDPEYYAQLTVTKAQGTLNQRAETCRTEAPVASESPNR